MKKNFFKFLLLGAFTFSLGAGFVGCKEYDDQIADLNTKVDALTKSVADLQADIDAGLLITSATPITGGFKITFSDGKSYDIVNGQKGDTGAKGKTPYVTIEDGKWVVYPDGKGTTTKEVLGTAVGEQGPKGNDGIQGPAGNDGIQGPAGNDGIQGPKGDNGSSVTVTTNDDGDIVITAYSGAGEKTGEYTVPYMGNTMVVTETDTYVQFTAIDETDGAEKTYRIGKVLEIPTSIKILNTIIEGTVAAGEPIAIKVSVSPSTAYIDITKPELFCIDTVDVGIVTRAANVADFEFSDKGYFVEKTIAKGAREGEYTINAKFSDKFAPLNNPEAVVPEGGWAKGGTTVADGIAGYGMKFDVCVAFIKNPASISAVSDSDTPTPVVVDYGYSRSVNSFMFADKVVDYTAGDAAFDPEEGEATSADAAAQTVSTAVKFTGKYDIKYVALSDATITAAAYEADGTKIVDIANADIAKYVTIAEATPAATELGKWTLTVNGTKTADKTAYEALEVAQPTFIYGSYIEISIVVEAEATHGTGNEHLTYTYKVYYVQTSAALTANTTQWLPNNSTGYDITKDGKYDALDVIKTVLKFPASTVATDLSLSDWTVKVWDAKAATPAWVASEKSYIAPVLDATGKMAVTLAWTIKPGVYKIDYTVVAAGKNVTLTQYVNVVIPDYTVDLQNAVRASYVPAKPAVVGPPAVAAVPAYLNYYADSAAAVVKVEDVLNSTTIKGVAPAAGGATTVDSQVFPAITTGVPLYQYLTEGDYNFVGGANSWGLVSDVAQLTATGKFALSVKLKNEGQSLPVYVKNSGTDYFENDVNVTINPNKVVAGSLVLQNVTGGGIFNTNVNYTTAKTTPVDLRDVIASVQFTNTKGSNYVATPTPETIQRKREEQTLGQGSWVNAYGWLVGATGTYLGQAWTVEKDSRVASVEFEVGDIELVNGGQLPPTDVLPLFQVVDGQLSAIDRAFTEGASIYQKINVVVTDVWGNEEKKEMKITVVFNTPID